MPAPNGTLIAARYVANRVPNGMGQTTEAMRSTSETLCINVEISITAAVGSGCQHPSPLNVGDFKGRLTYVGIEQDDGKTAFSASG
jgi:hypothetical protein